MRLFFLALLVLFIGFAIWVRVAPSDPAKWHRMVAPKAPGDYPAAGGFEAYRSAPDGPAALAALDQIIRATPSTTHLAGSVEEGMVTYITRTRMMRFPDYTTIWLASGPDEAPVLGVHGRLRFGQADLGVNRARIEGWLAQMPEGLLQD